MLVGAGDPIPVPGRGDLTYPFRAHSEYFYLTDRNRPGGILGYDPHEGWSDFVALSSASVRLWSGAPAGQPDGLPMPEFADWLKARAKRPGACLGVPPADMRSDPRLVSELRSALNHVR